MQVFFRHGQQSGCGIKGDEFRDILHLPLVAGVKLGLFDGGGIVEIGRSNQASAHILTVAEDHRRTALIVGNAVLAVLGIGVLGFLNGHGHHRGFKGADFLYHDFRRFLVTDQIHGLRV